MRYTASNENINEAVASASAFMTSNSVSSRETKRLALLIEQLLLLYREQDQGSAFALKCSRRRRRVRIRLRVEAAAHDYLSSGEDLIVAKLLSDLTAAARWNYRAGCNMLSFEVAIPVPGIWNLRFLLPYLSKTKCACICAVCAQGCMTAANIVIPILTAKLITAYTDSEIVQILVLAAVLMLCGVFCYFCEYLSHHFFVKVYNRLLNELETDLSRKVFRIQDACISKHGTGMFIQRMVSDTESVAAGFNNIAEALSTLVEALGIVIAVGIISLPLCLFFIFTAALTSVLEVRRIRRKAQDDREFRTQRDHYTGFISEMIHGVRDIKLQNSTDIFIRTMSHTIRDANAANHRLETASAQRVFLRKGVKELCDLVLYAGMALLILTKRLSPASAVIVLNYNLSIASFGWFFGVFLDYVNTISVSSERIFQILFNPEFQEEKFGALHPAEFRGDISIQNVTFAYPSEDPGVKSRPVLKNFNMELRAGEKIAIVGKSGSGKTTIFNLLTGLYRPDSGRILIDGTDYSALSADYIRGNISAVSQNPYIFNMTVRENLDLAGENISIEEMIRACKAACIYDDIMTMPNQFDTMLGEGGIHLSGGQRQRLAIARCLLRKTHMILLDEATSALDNETQSIVIDQIGKLFSDCTVITVAHRLSTIENSDRIFFLSDGRILSEGSHRELLETCEEYRALYREKRAE